MLDSTRSINRRHWLRVAAGTVAAAGLQGPGGAAEPTGRWSEQSIARHLSLLFEWLRTNFEARAETLASHLGREFPLEYDYLAPTDERRKLRMLERFAEGRLFGKAFDEHVRASLREFEQIRQTLAAAEAEAATKWQREDDRFPVINGRVYDTGISAGRLTVILDNSRSMSPYLAKLREEVRRDFDQAYFAEVSGCALDRVRHRPAAWYFSAPAGGVNPFTADRHLPAVPTPEERPHATYLGWTRDAEGALECMVELMHADAIYWFCDFDDPTEDEVIVRIGRKVLERQVKLFVHTLDRRPPALLAELVERSGGTVIRKRV